MLVVPDVEHLTGRIRCERCSHQAIDDIVDEETVVALLTVTEHVDRLAQQRAPHEDGEESLVVVAQALAWSVHVGQAHDRASDPVDLPVQEVELLGRVLRDAVDVDRCDGMVLVDGQVLRLAEELPRRREHDRDIRVVVAQPFEQRDLAARVDVEVEERVGHRVEVTDLTREVEDELGLRGCGASLRVAEVGADDRDRRITVTGASGSGSRLCGLAPWRA